MKYIYRSSILFLFLLTIVSACKKSKSDETPVTPAAEPQLIFKFKFDSTQVRLDGFGLPATMPAGHSGQSPKFNLMSAHYIELARTEWDSLGKGAVLYHAAQTTAGGTDAIDFDKSTKVGEGQTFFSMPLKSISTGSYQWLRISLAYQNYDVKYLAYGYSLTGTVASFIGFNSYVNNVKVKDSTIHVGANKLQGFWAFETTAPIVGTQVSTGQAPPGATTVPNPIFSTSPIPNGSCVVTGAFTSPLIITGNETGDIMITVSLSTNKSFEWKDANMNGIYEPVNGDTVVDMGIRGMLPIVAVY